MVSEVLWRQIEAMTVDDRLDLIDRIESTLLPLPQEQSASSAFRDLLQTRSRAMDLDPRGNLDAHETISHLRAKYV
jgi:hypothetical protein